MRDIKLVQALLSDLDNRVGFSLDGVRPENLAAWADEWDAIVRKHLSDGILAHIDTALDVLLDDFRERLGLDGSVGFEFVGEGQRLWLLTSGDGAALEFVGRRTVDLDGNPVPDSDAGIPITSGVLGRKDLRALALALLELAGWPDGDDR